MTYFRHLTNDRNAIVEGVLAVAAMALAVPVYLHGVWFLSLSLVGFGLFTLKSMSLSRHIPSRQPAVASKEKEGVVESSAKAEEIGVAPQAQAQTQAQNAPA